MFNGCLASSNLSSIGNLQVIHPTDDGIMYVGNPALNKLCLEVANKSYDIASYFENISNSVNNRIPFERYLDEGYDLNNVTQCGFYRLSYNHINTPDNIGVSSDWCQMIVMCAGGDTIAQILVNYLTSAVAVRSGNPPECGGTGTWHEWKKLIDNYTFSDLETKVNNLESKFNNLFTQDGNTLTINY